MVPQEHDVNVGAQPDVEGQIPAHMVRVFVDHDLVAVPQPVVAIVIIIGSNAEVEPAEPETVTPSARQAPNVMWSKSSRKVPVLPRVIQMVVRVSMAGVMPHPFAIGVNVGSLRVLRRIRVIALLGFRLGVGFAMGFSRTMRGRGVRYGAGPVLATFASLSPSMLFTVLGPCTNRERQNHHKNSTEPFHICLLETPERAARGASHQLLEWAKETPPFNPSVTFTMI